MKKLLQTASFAFLLLLPLLGQSQEVRISGRVVDGDTQEAVPFASIKIRKGGSATLAKEDGSFQLVLLSEKDSLIVETLGYEPSVVSVKHRKAQPILVKMCRREYLNEKPLCPTMPLDYDMRSDRASVFKGAKITGLPGTQYAFLVKNESRKTSGKLKSVSFFVGENAFPNEPFRLRIYQKDGISGKPDSELLTEIVYSNSINPEILGGWLAIDLTVYKVQINQKAFYIAVDYTTGDISRITWIKDYHATGQVLRTPDLIRNLKAWNYNIGQGWKLLDVCEYRRYHAMVKAEID